MGTIYQLLCQMPTVDKSCTPEACGLYCQTSCGLAPQSWSTVAAAAKASPRSEALVAVPRVARNGPMAASTSGTSSYLTHSPLLTATPTLGHPQSLPENNFGTNVQETSLSESSPKRIFYRELRKSPLLCCLPATTAFVSSSLRSALSIRSAFLSMGDQG